MKDNTNRKKADDNARLDVYFSFKIENYLMVHSFIIAALETERDSRGAVLDVIIIEIHRIKRI